MALACKDCDAPHDLDLGPDDGTCIVCGGALIEDEAERELVGGTGFNKAVVEAVADGLTAAAVARGKADRGEN